MHHIIIHSSLSPYINLMKWPILAYESNTWHDDDRKYTWEAVTKGTLTSAWKKLWPESVVECDFEGFETVLVKPLINEIVSLAKIMELELNNNDIDELVEEHSQELTNKEFTELHCVSQQDVV
ncbi:hypothetical protein AVEN_64565-1 [Araneus ventricosus]|uniref:Uncharacterized protein n=1 Tax=Araneus ventricosus TaxID=182803 RepID=A0A4Y2RZX1_ARAVE|nr:hypothetical protein AVEN_64565-1 [Araneus ventricosus]